MLNHSKEVAFLAGIMAKELGISGHVAARAAFVHDIGKAIDRDLQGTHLELGIDFLRKHGENEAVVMAVAAHHGHRLAVARGDDRPGGGRDFRRAARRAPRHPRVLRQAPGKARRDRRLVPRGVKGLRAQAGREIRIMVESEKISDEETVWLSKDIAKRIENELEYPGQIKVTVIRETRAVEYAVGIPDRRSPILASDLTEAGLIDFIQRRLPPPPAWLRVPAGDDAAVVEPVRGTLEVLTTDTLVESIHFIFVLQPC